MAMGACASMDSDGGFSGLVYGIWDYRACVQGFNMTALDKLPALEEFLGRHADEIEEIISFTKGHFEPSAEQLNSAASEVTQKKATLQGYLIDIEFYLISEKEEALKHIDEDDGPTAAKVKLEAATKGLRRMRDRMRAAVRSLTDQSMNIWGIRKGSR